MGRSLFARLLTAHTVSVETMQATKGRGVETFAPPVTVPGFLDGKRHLIRSRDGEEVISESTFYTTPDQAGRFTLGSRITTPDGAIAHVLKVNSLDAAGLVRRVEHVAVNLT